MPQSDSTDFFRQPLAFAGLFFIYMAVISVATIVPFIGSALALAPSTGE